MNDVTYADVRAINVAVEKLKIQLSTVNVQDGQNGRCKNHRFELSFTSVLTK